jgi:hypothetical protein
MLNEYNEICNKDPHFDVSDIFGTGREEDLIHNCGMLGIPGNISSCTLLHGMLLMVVTMSDTCRVVGDDAIGSGPSDMKKQILRLLKIIGTVSVDKMEVWMPEDQEDYSERDNRWHYTKRPIERLGDQVLFSDQAVIWPPLGNLHPVFGDAYHTIIYPEDENERYKRVANSMLSFVRQFQEHPLEREEIVLANRFMELVYRATDLKRNDADGLVSWSYSGVIAHSVEEGMFPSLITERLWNTAIRLPRYEKVNASEVTFEEDIELNGSRALKLAKDLGYAIVEPCFVTFRVSDNPEYFESWMSKELRFPVSSVYLLKHMPKFLVDSIFYAALSQHTDDNSSLDLDDVLEDWEH